MTKVSRERQLEYDKRWRAKYPDRYKATASRQVQRIQELKTKPCQDCGNVFEPCAMDFHHIDPTQKETRRKTMAEIAKCVLLCSNCHRIRHWGKGKPKFSLWNSLRVAA